MTAVELLSKRLAGLQMKKARLESDEDLEIQPFHPDWEHQIEYVENQIEQIRRLLSYQKRRK